MGSEPRNDDALVQVASLQTLKMRKWKDLPDADWVMIDECHNEPESSKVLFDIHSRAKCLGLTATPCGPSGTTLLPLYDVVVEPVKNDELIRDKWLLPTKCLCPSEPDTEGVWIDRDGKQRKGVDVSAGKEFNQEQLAQIVETCTVFSDVFEWWQPYSEMQTLVFVPRVKYAHGIAQQFIDRGVTVSGFAGGFTCSNSFCNGNLSGPQLDFKFLSGVNFTIANGNALTIGTMTDVEKYAHQYVETIFHEFTDTSANPPFVVKRPRWVRVHDLYYAGDWSVMGISP